MVLPESQNQWLLSRHGWQVHQPAGARADQECERDKTCREDPEKQRQQQAERARKSEFVVQEMEDELQDDEYAHML